MSPAATQPRACAIADTLGIVGERWALLVVRELFWGVHRFSDIQRNTGAPRDVLSARLRSLVEAGIAEQRPYSERPPRSGYHLTRAGRDLAPVLMALYEWGDRHLPSDDERDQFPHGDHRLEPVIEVRCRECGDVVWRDGRPHRHA
ncbi:MAG TPA: helix-turn-helix domain-containing protein [Capillimicrobium sp.]|nr:helix-turn-helix domain-containing protein [Capillimicrobium sp.]